jgi:hypothetical protein
MITGILLGVVLGVFCGIALFIAYAFNLRKIRRAHESTYP